MKKVDKKEKVEKCMKEFLLRNKDYAIEVYIRDNMTDNIIGQILIMPERIFKMDNEKCSLEWDTDCNVKFNRFTIIYEEIMACYEEIDEYNQQSVYMILKNGMSIEFECVGLREYKG